MRDVAAHNQVMTDNVSRQPKGVPVGGQFAAAPHSEPVVTLADRVTPFHDADGTDWEFDGDEYTDVYISRVGGIEARLVTDIRSDGVTATVVDHRGLRPLVIADGQDFDSLDEAKIRSKEIRERAHKYQHNRISTGSQSPWGTLQQVKAVAPGIDAVVTAGHGGFKLSSDRNQQVDSVWRERAGWYEEDCSWSKAVLTHSQDFSEQTLKEAHTTARRWYPDEYEAVVGKNPGKFGLSEFTPVTAGESHIVAEREFFAARAGTHDKVQDVQRLDAYQGMVVVTLSEIPADGREPASNPESTRVVLVPESEWKLAPGEKLTVPKGLS